MTKDCDERLERIGPRHLSHKGSVTSVTTFYFEVELESMTVAEANRFAVDHPGVTYSKSEFPSGYHTFSCLSQAELDAAREDLLWGRDVA